MEKFLTYLLAGFIGGIIRGLVGFVKNKTLEKANHFKPQYFLITILISGIVGAAAGILVDIEWQVSFLAGYACMSIVNLIRMIAIKFTSVLENRIFIYPCFSLSFRQDRIDPTDNIPF